MSISNITISIIVNGVEVPYYKHSDGTFIEGRKGSEFLIRIKNRGGRRVLIVPSVDGISTIDGDRATVDSSGYVVSPHGTLDIPGWMVDNSTVAKFAFGGKGESYATQINSDEANIGVIGIAAYNEESVPVKQYTHDQYNTWKRQIDGGTASPVLPLIQWCSSSAGTPAQTMNVSSSATTSTLRGMSTGNLGTEFGDAQEFNVSTVDFKRGGLLGVDEIFYDDREGLTARGITIVQVTKKAKPAAFGTSHCIPPKNWKK